MLSHLSIGRLFALHLDDVDDFADPGTTA